MGECDIFGLRAQKSDNRLFLSAPQDGTKADKVGKSRNGMAVTLGSPVSVRKSNNGRITSQNEFEMLSTK